MDLESLLTSLSPDGHPPADPEEAPDEGLVRLVRLPARAGTAVAPDPPLPRLLAARLQALGITGLWTHQAEALAAVRAGHNVIVSTGTASGKSLCFNLPVLERLLAERRARALYLYPTKALAQDQLRALRALAVPPVTAATYDGDTPGDERAMVRRYARIVLTNPDMAHFGLLASHARWADLFGGLAFVVVDEAHTLRGVFGSHVGCILRRLRRVARHYGADPTFILASATIGNPGDLAERLIGAPFDAVQHDAGPKGSRLFAFWNPPLKDEASGRRASSNWETARLMAAFVEDGVRTLAFAKSRKGAELVAKHARSIIEAPETARRVRAYRAGYLAAERREIEQQLFSGELLGVAATTALELGVDVGGLDAVVMNGFPGTVAQVWQQAGRAGRSGGESVAVLVGHEDPLDQYYLSHPDVLLTKPHEAALVDVTNPRILEPHLGCAAHELPLAEGEAEATFGEGAAPVVGAMVAAGDLAVRTPKAGGRTRLHWRRREAPGGALDLRSLGGEAYRIVDAGTGALLGTVDAARAFGQVHPGATYLHQGESYVVAGLDLAERVALVEAGTPDYFTQARDTSDLRVIGVTASARLGAVDCFLGKVEVGRQVVAYARRSIDTGELLDVTPLELPPEVLATVAMWYTVPPAIVARAGIDAPDLPGALHAAEHAGIGVLPLFAMADRWDIGGVSTALSADTGLPTVFIYDGYPGGMGIAERGFARAEEHLAATLEAVRGCRCERGCPACVQSPKCGNGNDPLDKAAAIRLMATILGEPATR
ncbi:MAG TPA: DEAD/DEAH box helicase [Actinomycetota bacterium]|nr:DEAD/DEAH box helicase [Actinomycetota bacterium]